MKSRWNRTAPGVLALAAFVLLSPTSRAQQQSTSQSQQQQQQQPAQQPSQQPPAKPGEQGQAAPSGQTPAAPKADPDEEKAYQEFTAAKADDYDKQIQTGEDFVKKYPQGRYTEYVYARLSNAYFNKQQLDKMYESSDKALALNPNDVSVLVLVGWVIPHNVGPGDPDSDRRLAKAETYEKHALDVLPTLPKPDGLSDDQFTSAKTKEEATAHSGLGLIYFREQKSEDSLKELQLATAKEQSDPVDFFIMGVDLDNLKRYNDAADAFQKCAQIPGAMQDRCKQQGDKAKAQASQSPK